MRSKKGADRMIEWKFNPENYNAEGYQLVPPGQYRVRIEDAEEKVSKTGKPMIKLTLKASGYNSRLWYYMVFDSTSSEAVARTDDNLGRIYDSFNIPQGNLNLYDWKGKVGAAEIANEPDNKEVMRARISWFLRRKEQEDLPAWQEHPVKFAPQPFDPNADVPF